jgi:hypothetical protein
MALLSGRRDEGITVLTWAFVREPAGPAKSLAAVVVARAGVVDRLTQELLAMGGTEGPRAADLLHQLIAYAGYGDQVVPASPAPVPAAPPVPTVPTPAAPLPPPPVPPTDQWPTQPPAAPPSAWRRPD